MHEGYFGFKQRPFAAAPLPKWYFPASSIDAARQRLARCLERAAGIGFLSGAAGTGKTLLLQVLAENFSDRFLVGLVPAGPLSTRRELLQAILFELGLPYANKEEGELRLALLEHLRRGEHHKAGLLLLIDEAHALPTVLLEELRLMTNWLHHGEPLVRLVLAGSLDWEERLAAPELQALSQRLAARCYLEPFDKAETSDYVRFQVAVAGGQVEQVFQPEAIAVVYQASDGIPRLINQLCDHALTLAYANDRRPVTPAVVQDAWADLQQLPAPWANPQQGGVASGDTAHQVIEFGGDLDEADNWLGPPTPAPPADELDFDLRSDVEIAPQPAGPEPSSLASLNSLSAADQFDLFPTDAVRGASESLAQIERHLDDLQEVPNSADLGVLPAAPQFELQSPGDDVLVDLDHLMEPRASEELLCDPHLEIPLPPKQANAADSGHLGLASAPLLELEDQDVESQPACIVVSDEEDKLEVLVNPYAILDEADDDFDALPPAAPSVQQVLPPGGVQPPSRAAQSDDSSAGEAEPARWAHRTSSSPVVELPDDFAGADEEVIADHYAQLDARNAAPLAAHSLPRPASRFAARTAAQPSQEPVAADSGIEMHDPRRDVVPTPWTTPPGTAAASPAEGSPPAGSSDEAADWLVIEDEPDAELSPDLPAIRGSDYRQLFSKLKGS